MPKAKCYGSQQPISFLLLVVVFIKFSFDQSQSTGFLPSFELLGKITVYKRDGFCNFNSIMQKSIIKLFEPGSI